MKARTAIIDALKVSNGEAQRQAIREWALINGGFSAHELQAPAPDQASDQYTSFVDYTISWELTNLKRDGLIENPKWGTWRLTSAAAPPASRAIDKPMSQERLAELQTMPYWQYLRTPEWRRTRAAVLLRSGNACSLDTTHTKNLDVHHRTYERLGAELTTDIVVLCHACHQLHHKAYGRPRREHTTELPALHPSSPSPVTHTAGPTKRRTRSLLRRLLAN